MKTCNSINLPIYWQISIVFANDPKDRRPIPVRVIIKI